MQKTEVFLYAQGDSNYGATFGNISIIHIPEVDCLYLSENGKEKMYNGADISTDKGKLEKEKLVEYERQESSKNYRISHLNMRQAKLREKPLMIGFAFYNDSGDLETAQIYFEKHPTELNGEKPGYIEIIYDKDLGLFSKSRSSNSSPHMHSSENGHLLRDEYAVGRKKEFQRAYDDVFYANLNTPASQRRR